MHNNVLFVVASHGLFPFDSNLQLTGSLKKYKLHFKCLFQGVLLHGHYHI